MHPEVSNKELLFYLAILIWLQGVLSFDISQHYEASSHGFSGFSLVICTEIVWKSIVWGSSVLCAGVQSNSVTLKSLCRHLSESSRYRVKPKPPTRYYCYQQKQRQIITLLKHIIYVGKDWNILTKTCKITPNVFCYILKKAKFSHWQHCHRIWKKLFFCSLIPMISWEVLKIWVLFKVM